MLSYLSSFLTAAVPAPVERAAQPIDDEFVLIDESDDFQTDDDEWSRTRVWQSQQDDGQNAASLYVEIVPTEILRQTDHVSDTVDTENSWFIVRSGDGDSDILTATEQRRFGAPSTANVIEELSFPQTETRAQALTQSSWLMDQAEQLTNTPAAQGQPLASNKTRTAMAVASKPTKKAVQDSRALERARFEKALMEEGVTPSDRAAAAARASANTGIRHRDQGSRKANNKAKKAQWRHAHLLNQ